MSPVPTGRLRRPHLLIIGCGDIGMRVARLLRARYKVLALTTNPARAGALRALGVVPLVGDLDHAPTLARLAGLADAVLHLAPPAADGAEDLRTARLLQALARHGRPRCLVYASTSGVYGDVGGAFIDETRAVDPATARARRRADAEQRVRWFGRALGVRTCVLRIPGIYAVDRPGGHPRERLLRGAPVLRAEDDVYTNHIHADDLARACVAAIIPPTNTAQASTYTELWKCGAIKIAAVIKLKLSQTGVNAGTWNLLNALSTPPAIDTSEINKI